MGETTSKELSHELDELGFRADGEYDWNYVDGKWKLVNHDDLNFTKPFLKAYQAHELLRALPRTIDVSNFVWWLHISKASDTCMQVEYQDWKQTIKGTQFHESLTEALGLLVKWCVEQGHIEVKS